MEPTILVVEEDLDLSKLFDYILRIDGYDIIVTRDWREARTVFATRLPDLIICDWAFSITSAYLWADDLRGTAETADIPILLVCGESPTRDVTRLLDSAGVLVIEKPFDIFDLRACVAALLTPRERSVGAV